MCARMILTILLWLCSVTPAAASLRADLNGDCRVDIHDLAILMSEWMLEEDCEMSLGPELVTNGGFDSGDNWNLFGGPVIDSGKLTLTTLLVGTANQIIGIVSGKTYQVVFEVSSYNNPSDNTIECKLGTSEPAIDINGNGNYSENVLYNAGDSFIGFRCVLNEELFSCKIDNVSVREVLSGGGGTLIENYYEHYGIR